jgi:hypothetical protein
LKQAPYNRENTSLWPRTNPEGVRLAAQHQTQAVGNLYEAYQGPLGIHLRGKFHAYPAILNHWEDLLSDFTAKKILADGWLARWDAQRGRFRDFLKSSLNNFVWDWWKSQTDCREREAQIRKSWAEHRFFTALRPISLGEYEAIVLDHSGQTISTFRFPHSAAGWKVFDLQMKPFKRCPVGINGNCSAPEDLLKRDYDVFQEAGLSRESGEPAAISKLAQALRSNGYQWWQLRAASDEAPGVEVPSEEPVLPGGDFEGDLLRLVLAEVVDRLERDCKDQRRAQPRYRNMWEVFRLKVLDPIFEGSEAPPSQEIAAGLKGTSSTQVDFMVFSARQMFREHLDDVLSEYQKSGKATGSDLRPIRMFLEAFARKKSDKKKMGKEQ